MFFTFSLISISLSILPLYLFLYNSYSYIFIINQIKKSSYLKLSSFLSLCSQIGKLTHTILWGSHSAYHLWEAVSILPTHSHLEYQCFIKAIFNHRFNANYFHSCHSLGPIHFLIGCIIIYTFKFINFLTNSLLLTPMSYLLINRR